MAVLEGAAAVAAIVGAVAAVAGTGAAVYATKEQNKAQEKAAKLQQAGARLEQMHRARRLVAERRMLQAEITQNTYAQDARASSSMSGANSSLQTQTAANIGSMQTQLATDVSTNNALLAGARNSARWNTWAGVFDAAGSVAGSAGFQSFLQKQMPYATSTPATPQERAAHWAKQY